jgi:EAL domain-containing protein (putative c-di-GMP-specific phosphodiesterase class I)/DNA-binding CsgD family transcriptional regulator
MAAIANDELTLAFQPVVTRTPRQLLKLEALLRWDHPVRGRVSPADFLPIAEADVPTIDALGAWVVSAAIDAYQALAEAGLRVPIAINLSPHNLHDLRLPDFIEARMRAGGMPAGDLHVEVTETAALADNVDTLDVLSRLRLKGIALSIDDFGTGYASLRVLQRMPYSEIKIDRTFITDMTKSRDSLAIVKSMIDLATNMQMKCVAEGIETEDTAALLEQLGVSALQGNLFAKPMSPEALPAWWTTWTQQPPPRAVGIAVAEKPLQADSSPSRDDSELAAPAGDPGAPSPRLPPRQSQIMQLVAEGLTVKEIARRLGLGAGTVKVHLALAYSALGARNRIDAIRRLATIGHLSTGPATTIADDLAPRGHASIAIAL